MNRILKSFALVTCGLLLSSAAQAETITAATNLTCQQQSGSPISVHAYAYSLSLDNNSGPFYLAVYTNIGNFDTFLNYLASGSQLGDCTLGDLAGVSLINPQVAALSVYATGVNVDAGSLTEDQVAQSYTLVTFSAGDIFYGRRALAPAAQGTPEERQHKLELFESRIPPLVLKKQ